MMVCLILKDGRRTLSADSNGKTRDLKLLWTGMMTKGFQFVTTILINNNSPHTPEKLMSHFNDKAKEWDDESKIKMMGLSAKKTLETLDVKVPVDILDFGCGTGLFGLQMMDIAKSLTGIDTSEGMLEVFKKKTVGHENIKSALVDLERENYAGQFDLIISSMAFHHLTDPKEMVAKFKSMLKPGGATGNRRSRQRRWKFSSRQRKNGRKTLWI